MSKLVYVDTNVYLDFLVEGRIKSFADDAFRLFNRAMHCEFEILMSEKVKTELRPNIAGNESALLFEMLKPKLRMMAVSEEDKDEAGKLDPVDTADALHAILARKHKAECIVTQNIRHFSKFAHVIRCVRPSEI